MDDADDFNLEGWLDLLSDDVGQTGTDPTTGGGEGSGGFDMNTFLSGINKLLSGTSSVGPIGQFLAAAGVGKLLNRVTGGSGQAGPAGYRGGIPEYTATRTQTPMAQQRPAGYRPGQGGITYFNPTAYTATGKDIAAPVAGTVNDASPPAGNAAGGYMPSGIAMLARGGSGNRYLRGPGDGVSDSIPAKFERSGQPARLADGEFVIDARTVSELGNGSSEAGARKLYAMLDHVHSMRKQAERGKPSGADRELNKLVRGK